MPNIIPYDDSPVVDPEAMADKHIKLVDHLKNSLFAGQTGFIKAGQYLSEIRTQETYKFEDASNDTTWADFCSRPDIPIGGVTAEGRVRTSQKLMKVWDDIASRKDVDSKLLSRIGYTKLALVASAMDRPDNKTSLNDWLTKAESLSSSDLQAETADGGKTLAEVNDCEHENYKKIKRWKCDDCKKILTKEPDEK